MRFFAPDVAFGDAEKYLPPLLEKRGKPHEVSGSLGYLREIVEPVPLEIYSVFESDARLRLRGRDEDDWPVLATALSLACAVWSEDLDFFGTGIAVWTTNRIEIFLKRQAKAIESGKSNLLLKFPSCPFQTSAEQYRSAARARPFGQFSGENGYKTGTT